MDKNKLQKSVKEACSAVDFALCNAMGSSGSESKVSEKAHTFPRAFYELFSGMLEGSDPDEVANTVNASLEMDISVDVEFEKLASMRATCGKNSRSMRTFASWLMKFATDPFIAVNLTDSGEVYAIMARVGKVAYNSFQRNSAYILGDTAFAAEQANDEWTCFRCE